MNTIKAKRYLDIVNEEAAAEAITPGQLVELTSAGTVQAHSTAGGDAARRVAMENELEGKTLEDAYAADDQVFVWDVIPGEEVLVSIESGDDPSVGDKLESAGNGNVTTGTTGDAVKLFVAIGEKVVDDDGNHRVPARRI